MSSSVYLRKLFEGLGSADENLFRSAALQIIAEEKQKKNHQLAEDLMRMLDSLPKEKFIDTILSDQAPKDKERQLPLVDVQKFDQSFQDIILNSENLDTLKKVILEFRKSEILKAHGVSASKKLLFCGPPGCGKTLAARIVSSELMIPLLYTRFDVIVSSYLGETSANLRKIFDFSTQSTWVVLFDEFDAIGKNRSDDGEHGELKRVINSFLQLLDTFKGNSLIIAATNHEGLLDPALWRRFDEIIYFDRPDSKQILSLIESKLQSFKHDKFNETIAKRFSGLTHADVERVCFESIKYCVLQNEDIVTETVLLRALKTQLKRAAIVKSAKVKLR